MPPTPNFGWPQPVDGSSGWGPGVRAMVLQQDLLLRNPAFDITAYGAVADGSDCAASIQAALDAAGATVGPVAGGVVLIPKGQFTIQSQIQVPNFVRLVGVGSRASRIIAGASFPINTPVVRLGKVADATIYGTSVEYLRIDANNIAGSTCLYSNSANEKSGAFFCNFPNFRVVGIDYTGTSFAQVNNCELSGSALGSTAAIRALATTGPTVLSGQITINNQAVATDGLLVSSMFVINGMFHVEFATNAVTVTGGSGGYIDFILGHQQAGANTVTNLLNVGPSFTGCLRAYNLVHGVSGVLVNDQPSGQTVSGSQLTSWECDGSTSRWNSGASQRSTILSLHNFTGGAGMKTKAGTPSDADFSSTPPTGTIVVDTTASKIWVRTGAATWKSITVA